MSRTSKPDAGPTPVQTANIKQLAENIQTRITEASSVHEKILDRIKKSLAKANHPNTVESEAQAAWRLSTRLMQRYNVTQADLLEEATTNADYAAKGGQSTVAISRAKADGLPVLFQTWVSDVGAAMNSFFETKCYTTAYKSRIDWVFYCIAGNTVAAAMAFEMAHNLALEWAGTKGKHKNSYLLGVGAGLCKQASHERQREKQKAEEAEKQQREDKVKQEREDQVRTLTKGAQAEQTRGIKARVSPCPDEEKKPILEEQPLENEKNAIKLEIQSEGGYEHKTAIKMEQDEEKVATIKSEGEDKKVTIKEEKHGDCGDRPIALDDSDEEGEGTWCAYAYDISDDDNDNDLLASDPVYISDGNDDFTTEDPIYVSDGDEDLSTDNAVYIYISDGEESIRRNVKPEPTFKEEDEHPIDLTADLKDQLLRQAMPKAHPDRTDHKPSPASLINREEHEEVETQPTTNPWNTTQALVRFRQSAERVAKEYLDAQDIKMKKGKKRKRIVRDQEVYRRGVRDGKKIDVRRKRIEGADEQ